MLERLSVRQLEEVDLPRRLSVLHFLSAHFGEHEADEMAGFLAERVIDGPQVLDHWQQRTVSYVLQLLFLLNGALQSLLVCPVVDLEVFR